jgi:uncharacterized protein Usg
MHTPGDLEKMLKDYRLTTAEILYHFPDHPRLLQTYLWQELDLAPKYPQLHKFLGFWEDNLEGRLHSVRVDSMTLITPSDTRIQCGEWLIH